jgi:hypothetical protein
MIGHRIESICRRYAITDEGMLKEAGENWQCSTDQMNRKRVAEFYQSSRQECAHARDSRLQLVEFKKREVVARHRIELPIRGFSVL